MNKKIIAIILVIAIVLNLVLFTFGKISPFLFWGAIITISIITYKVMPHIKN